MKFSYIALISISIFLTTSCGLKNGIWHTGSKQFNTCSNTKVIDNSHGIAVLPTTYDKYSIKHALLIEESLLKLGVKVYDPPKIRPNIVKKTELNSGTQGSVQDFSTEKSFKFENTNADFFIKADQQTRSVKLINKKSGAVIAFAEFGDYDNYTSFKNLYQLLVNAQYPTVQAKNDDQLKAYQNQFQCFVSTTPPTSQLFTVYNIEIDKHGKEYKKNIEKALLELGVKLIDSPGIKEITVAQGLSMGDTNRDNYSRRSAGELIAEKYLVYENTPANYIVKPYSNGEYVKIIDSNSKQILSILNVPRFNQEQGLERLNKALSSGGLNVKMKTPIF